ncbi:cytochrome P450 [Rubinisphaera sp. ICM_H10]|nr:cytochrome P450 [Rubinisphaera margarita]
MISALVAAEQEGERLSEDELLATVFLLLIAGHETTVHLLSLGLLTLLQHPEQKTALMADWSKSRPAVDEILRQATPIQMTKPRYVARDIEICGHPFFRGDVIVPLLAAANSDPKAFSEPEEFRIDRDSRKHVAFGSGPHVCLGLKLARVEAEIAFEQLLTTYPNLELAIPEKHLQWYERPGARAMKEMPIRLNQVAHPLIKEQVHVA